MTHPSKSLVAILLLLPLALAGCTDPPPRVTGMQPGLQEGGRAVAVSADPTSADRIVVASESGGLFRSVDRGASWSHVSGSTTFWFSDVAHVPADPDVVLATAHADTRVASAGGIWRSVDAGASWTRVDVTPPVPSCLAEFGAYALEAEAGRDRVWAGTLCGLAWSDDRGATWTYVPASANYAHDKVSAVVAPQAGRVAIVTDAGVKVSTDDGASWTPSGAGLPGGGTHNSLAGAPNDASHLYRVFNYWWHDGSDWRGNVTLYRSLDFGGSWSRVIDDLGLNRPPLVRTANALSGAAGSYDVYWSDGGCRLQRATATTGNASTLSAWTGLAFDHCDPADLAFGPGQRTPLLLATDGGLHRTSDDGASWTFTGGGAGGYNALQITEVTGQLHAGRQGADLYFGTQDNHIWASPDYGATWPHPNRCCEGFFLNVWREPLPAGETRVTGVSCAGCGNFISGPGLAAQMGFPNPPNEAGNPRLVAPGAYVQNTRIPGLTVSVFALTTDNGASWTSRYGFPEEVRDLPKVSGPASDPVVFTAVRVPGSTNGHETLQIKRVANVLGTLTPLVSHVGGGSSGLGSIGIYPTMFAWYKPFAVDPRDPNLLIASDVTDQKVKLSADSGATWTTHAGLTDLVTGSGAFKFSWGPFTQTSTFAFNPDCRGHVVVGTRQAGVFESFDRGATWTKVPGSEAIPEVSSVFFGKKDGNAGEMVVSSYGRGLWKVKYTCPEVVLKIPKPEFVLKEPLIFWKGAKVPLREIWNPDVCPVCGYFLLEGGGRVLDYRLDQAGKVTDVVVSGGEVRGYTWDGEGLPLPFRVERGDRQGGFAGDERLVEALEGKTQVKGLFLERGVLRGAILHTEDLTTKDLPQVKPEAPRIRVSIDGPMEAYRLRTIDVAGAGFAPGVPVEVLVDGRPAPLVEDRTEVGEDGTFRASIEPLFEVGGHTVLVRQKSERGLIEDASTFLLTVSDEALEAKLMQQPG